MLGEELLGTKLGQHCGGGARAEVEANLLAENEERICS